MTGNKFLFGLVITAILLICVPASASEEYTLGIFGNANEDDTINIQDMTYTERIILEYNDETQLADAKYDGEVNILDVTQIELITLRKDKELTYLDSFGEAKTVDKPIERIVIQHYRIAEIIRTLGAEDRVVGIDESITWYPVYYPELSEKPCVGGHMELNVEAILASDADLVISTSPGPGVMDKLEAADVDVLLTSEPIGGLKDIILLGYILDEEENAQEYIEWHRSYADMIQKKVSDIPKDEKLKVFIEPSYGIYDPGTATWGESGGPTTTVELAGGKSISHDLPGSWISVEKEWVLDQNPDVIIGVQWYEAYGLDNVTEIKAHHDAIMGAPGFDHIIAVEDDRVYMIKSLILYEPTLGVCHFAKWFHPKLFEDLNPRAVHQEFVDKFQGIDFDVSERGVFMYHPEKYPEGH
jgi:iron complex transport system substrate-binding protein